MTQSFSHRIICNLDSNDFEKLRTVAKKEKTSMSQILRKAWSLYASELLNNRSTFT